MISRLDSMSDSLWRLYIVYVFWSTVWGAFWDKYVKIILLRTIPTMFGILELELSQEEEEEEEGKKGGRKGEIEMDIWDPWG